VHEHRVLWRGLMLVMWSFAVPITCSVLVFFVIPVCVLIFPLAKFKCLHRSERTILPFWMLSSSYESKQKISAVNCML